MDTDELPVFGRFRAVKILGKGAQGEVYLAHDPRLNRHVAVKSLAAAAAAEQRTTALLLEEALIASRLQHPNIVDLYEVGEEDGRPYLVFEYVEGRTLREVLRTEGALPLVKAVPWMQQILEGMAVAHRAGVLHVDLSPANILISNGGLPRVMDFGLATLVGRGDGSGGAPRGTVQYMSPEHFGEAALSPASDVFSLGLIFYEMLTGEPAITGKTDFHLMYRIANDQVRPPSFRNRAVPRKLDLIVYRALQKRPAARYPDAGAMADALRGFRVPRPAGQAEAEAAPPPAAVEFLLRRMSRRSDFPVLCQSVGEINRMAGDDSVASAEALAKVVLKDFGLTNKLLRMVNSAFYGQRSAGITSISHAIMVLGFEEVRLAAASLMLAAQLQPGESAAELRDTVLRAFVAAMAAKDFGPTRGLWNREELFVCALFQSLGRLLVMHYLPEDWADICARAAGGNDEQEAARDTLGVTLEALGMEVARSWGFPDALVQAMQGLPRGPVPAPETKEQKVWHCAAFANELCRVVGSAPPEVRERALADLAQRYAASLAPDSAAFDALLRVSLERARAYAGIIGFDAASSEFVRDLQQWLARPAAQQDAPTEDRTEVRTPPAAAAPQPLAEVAAPAAPAGMRGTLRRLLRLGA